MQVTDHVSEIRTKVRSLTDLPPVSVVAQRLLTLLTDEDVEGARPGRQQVQRPLDDDEVFPVEDEGNEGDHHLTEDVLAERHRQLAAGFLEGRVFDDSEYLPARQDIETVHRE